MSLSPLYWSCWDVGLEGLEKCQLAVPALCLKHSHTSIGYRQSSQSKVELSKAHKASFSNPFCPPLLPLWQQLGCQFAVAIAYPTFHLVLSLFTFFYLVLSLSRCFCPEGSSSEHLLYRGNHTLLHWQQLEYLWILWWIAFSISSCSWDILHQVRKWKLLQFPCSPFRYKFGYL